jgi:hypothetical protein
MPATGLRRVAPELSGRQGVGALLNSGWARGQLDSHQKLVFALDRIVLWPLSLLPPLPL